MLYAKGLWTDLLAALAALAVASAAAELLYSTFGLTRLSLLFLAAVAVTASMRGLRGAIIAAISGVLFYRIFVNLRLDEASGPVEDLVNGLVFLLVALITGTVAGRVRDQGEQSRERAETMETLFEVSRNFADAIDEETVWSLVPDAMRQVTGTSAVSAFDADGVRRSGSGPILDPPAEGECPAGLRTRRMRNASEHVGQVLWAEPPKTANSSPELDDLVVELAAAALARAQASRTRMELAAQATSNRLREALLSSISHDFRSPLAAIIGSSTSLLEYHEKFSPEVRRDLLLNIQEEGEKLNDYVANLLNMIRLQSGVIEVHAEPAAVREILDAVSARIKKHSANAPDIRLSGDCVVNADPLLLEQALYNVIDNAARHGGCDGSIDVDFHENDGACVISIADHGPGLPASDLGEQAFDRFHFARKGQRSGTGLGLSITKGFIEAMGGKVTAQRRDDGQSGLNIVVTLPGVS